MSKVVLVTGARSGFGKLIAVEAARRGHVVYAGLRDVATAEEQLLPLCAEAGVTVHPVALDITDAEQRDAAVAQILEAEGRIDVLVNNAGVALGGFLEQLEEDELRQLFDVNVFGTWALTKAVLPAMRKQHGGRVIMISSMSGRYAWPGLAGYAGSKFALEGLCEGWRRELQLFGVDLVLVEPGAFKTDIFARNRRVGRRVNEPGPYLRFAKRLDAFAERMVHNGGQDPQRVADLCCDLAEARRTRARYPVGRDAKFRTRVFPLIPDAVLDRVFRRILGG